MKTMPKAPFGRTGHISSRALLGAAAFWDRDPDTAERTLDMAVERGVNHIDVAASYGKAEQRIGPWLARNRKKVFLATKTEKRTYDGAREELRRSLELLKVDGVDLWQMHFLSTQEEWETAMGSGGALEAFIEARDEGLVKWLGVTSHGVAAPRMHLMSLERFDFDSVLLPWNWTMSRNEGYAADFWKLHALCRERNTAVQLIKTASHRPWRDGEEKTRTTWYKPLEDQADLDASIRWAMGVEGSFINTSGDVELLPKVLDAVAGYEGPPPDDAVAACAEAGGWEPLFT